METNKERQELQQNFKDMANDYNCIDEQTIISSTGVELCCLKAAMNYRNTATELQNLLYKSSGVVNVTQDGRVLINSIDNLKLAYTILEEIKHYYNHNKTADETLIINRAKEWTNTLQNQRHTPKEYARFVLDRFNKEYNHRQLDEAINKRLKEWAARKEKQPNTLNDERAAKPQLPEELATPEALKYWENAKREQLIKENYSFIGTNYERAEFAYCFSEKLCIKNKWKYFQQLWDCKAMAVDYLQAHNFGYIKDDFVKRLNKVFR